MFLHVATYTILTVTGSVFLPQFLWLSFLLILRIDTRKGEKLAGKSEGFKDEEKWQFSGCKFSVISMQVFCVAERERKKERERERGRERATYALQSLDCEKT